MVSSKNKEPNSNTADLNSGNEGSGVFCVACRNAAPPFEKKKRILNQMAELVEIFIIFPQMFTVFSWRNDRYHSLASSLKKNRARIIPTISQKVFRMESLY